MSRWIDAEYCEDFFDRWESRVKNAEPVTIDVVQNTRTLLRDAPSIDIVRCKECRYCKKKRGIFKGEPIIFYRCTENNRDVEADDFCSWGQKGDENVETD